MSPSVEPSLAASADAGTVLQRYHALLARSSDLALVCDRDIVIRYATPSVEEMFGYTPDEVVGVSGWAFVHPEDEPRVRAAWEAAFAVAGRHPPLELRVRHRSGEWRWVEERLTNLLDDPSASGMVVNIHDITDRKRTEEELRRLALYDRLTGLPNRALLTDRLHMAAEQRLHEGRHIAVLFCDVDRFKLVNDNRGHDAGDRLLRHVADRLQALVRPGDTVARFGGDEFVVVCPDIDATVARQLAVEVCAAVAAPFEVDDAPIAVSMSVGIATTEDVRADELLQAADRALYFAKDRGRGRVAVHDELMRQSSQGRLQLVTDLRRAIDERGLRLHYQPIVHASGSPFAVEALLRWPHPQRGQIPPLDVIALAESNGLMRALGAWTIRQACIDMAGCPAGGGSPLRVGVNVSAAELRETDIVAVVESALRDSGLPPDRLTLEVTETAVVTDLSVTRPVLQGLKNLGIRLALDDFGTGYSSLTYLREFPVDAIKIDRSFVDGMVDDSDDLAIVASLVSLAAAVNVDVIAEGVETEEQAATLRRLGCTAAQGYLWSPAVPLEELPAALRRINAPHGSRQRRPRGVDVDEAVRARVLALHRSGASPTTIAAALNAGGLLTAAGTRWHRNTVARIITEHDYPDLRLRR